MDRWLRMILIVVACLPVNKLSNIIVYAIEDWFAHFLLAFSLGCVVYALTLTMLRVGSSWAHRLTQRQESTGVASYMNTFPFLAALLVALLSHWFLDYLGFLWFTPMAEGLNLR